MGVVDRLLTAIAGPSRAVTFSTPSGSFDNIWPYVNFGGTVYPLGLNTTMPASHSEEIGSDFSSLVSGAYKANGIVFATILTRMQVFSQARFQFQNLNGGRTGTLFGTPALSVLEHPWTGATTGDMLTQMLADADLAGNSFQTLRGGQVRRMRPDWTEFIIGSPTDPKVDSWDIDAEVLGYVYWPGGKRSGRKAEVLLREQVAHFKPIPDPASRFRGMSWLTPIIREIQADGAATSHKLKFFENGATPNLIVKRPETMTKELFLEWVRLMEQGHAGVANAYKNLYLMGGADATVVGADLKQIDFKVTQGAGETRIAAAAGTHPVIVGLSEGMQGSSLNAGNFNSARRLMADKTLWHLWGNAAGSLEMLVKPPPGSRLWIDGDIPFLREDRKDAAEIQQIKAASIRQLVDAGYVPASVVAAVDAEDMTLLVHSGLYSVQLQPPAPKTPPAKPTDTTAADMPMSPNGTKPVAPGVQP